MLPRRHCAGERKNGKNKRESGVSSKHFDTRKLPNCEGWTVITEVSLNARALIVLAVSVSKSTNAVRGFKEWNVKWPPRESFRS